MQLRSKHHMFSSMQNFELDIAYELFYQRRRQTTKLIFYSAPILFCQNV